MNLLVRGNVEAYEEGACTVGTPAGCGVDWNVVEKHHNLCAYWVLEELVASRRERERQELQ